MAARPTRSQLIGTIVSDAVLQSRMTWNAYAEAVVQHYHATTDVADRLVEFHVATTADNADQATRNNTQTVKRMLIGEIRMHVDIEESLIGALPEAWRERLLTALLERQGLIYAKAPRPADAPSHFNVPCELMRSTAVAIERIEPMLRDQVIGPDDLPYFEAAERGLNLVIGVCLSTAAQMHAVRAAAAAKPGKRSSH